MQAYRYTNMDKTIPDFWTLRARTASLMQPNETLAVANNAIKKISLPCNVSVPVYGTDVRGVGNC